MMKTPAGRSPIASVDQNLLAEVTALRDRVQVQQGLFEILLERLRPSGGEHHYAPLDMGEPLPVHPLRADSLPEGGDAANTVEEAEPAAGLDDLHLVPTGTTWWPMPEKELQPMAPNPGWELYGIGSTANVVGFSLCGMKLEEMEKAVELVRSAQRQKSTFVPVFLTDHADLSIFRKHGYVAEYLPEPVTTMSLFDEPSNRRRMIERKWHISRIFDFDQVMREAALDHDWISIGGPKLEPRSTTRPSSTRTKKTAIRRQVANKRRANKSRRNPTE